MSGKKNIIDIKILIKTLQRERELERERERVYTMQCKDNDAVVSRPATMVTILKTKTETEKGEERQMEKSNYNLLSFKDV